MSKLFEKRKEVLGGNLWSCLLQKGIDSKIKDLQLQNTKKESLRDEIGTGREKVSLLTSEIRQGGARCKVCNAVSEGITEAEAEEKASEKAELEQSIIDMEDEIAKLGQPSMEIVRLSKYKNSSGFSRLSDLEWRMGKSPCRLARRRRH